MKGNSSLKLLVALIIFVPIIALVIYFTLTIDAPRGLSTALYLAGAGVTLFFVTFLCAFADLLSPTARNGLMGLAAVAFAVASTLAALNAVNQDNPWNDHPLVGAAPAIAFGFFAFTAAASAWKTFKSLGTSRDASSLNNPYRGSATKATSNEREADKTSRSPSRDTSLPRNIASTPVHSGDRGSPPLTKNGVTYG